MATAAANCLCLLPLLATVGHAAGPATTQPSMKLTALGATLSLPQRSWLRTNAQRVIDGGRSPADVKVILCQSPGVLFILISLVILQGIQNIQGGVRMTI